MAVTPLNRQRGEFVFVWSPGSHSAILLRGPYQRYPSSGLEMLQLDPEPGRASPPRVEQTARIVGKSLLASFDFS